MRRLLPFALVLLLPACDPPMEEILPASYHTVDRGAVRYEVRAQFDPFERGWFVRVFSIQDPLGLDDVDLATSIVEEDLGPRVCDGGQLHVDPGEVWNPLAGDEMTYLVGLDTWQFVARCA